MQQAMSSSRMPPTAEWWRFRPAECAQTTVGTGLNYPCGVAVDGAGDVFIADINDGESVRR